MSTHTIKGMREEFKRVGKFHTPPELSAMLRGLIPGEPRDVYDPTCGAGALLAEFADDTPKFGQDIDGAALEDAYDSLPNFSGVAGDVLTDPAFTSRKFHAIVANPPFSVKWEPPLIPMLDPRFEDAPTVPTAGKADFAFLLHVLHMLADDGTAAVLQFPGVLYRGGREQELRRWMIEQNVIDSVVSVPGGHFTDTAISTCVIVFRKDRLADDPVEFINTEDEATATVSLEQIAANDFNLSVNLYAHREPEPRPVYDPLAGQQQIVDLMCRNLTRSLRQQKHVCEIEGWDFEPIRRRVREAVEAA